jgi:voltage-gated potassium channel
MADTALVQAAPPEVAAPRPPVATPAEELGLLVAWGAMLFYGAESGENPAVRSYWDALHYIATSLSVGYANIFPVTPLGKAIGAVVMMVGPALSARALDGAAPARGGEGEAAAVVGKLDEILVELRRAHGG